MTKSSTGPLAGIRVVDLTTVISGPVCTMLLADQGADVVKVEPPGGDIARRTAGNGEFTAMFVSSNRGKLSIALDLKQPEALEAVRRLISKADVLVQNFRPGTLDRLGLGEPAMRALNPGLIYASISGVGETGPYVDKRVYDPIVQSLSGLADVQADRVTGRPQMVRVIMADKTTAVFAAQAICAALFARERNGPQHGKGQHIRLSMLDTMVAFIWPESMTQYTVVGQEGTGVNTTARPDLIFKTLDGYVTVGSVSNDEWKGLCGVLGKPEWVDDPRFRTPALRGVNAAERLTLVGELLALGTSADWFVRLDAADVPCAPVLTRAQVIEDPQVRNNGLIETFEQPGLGLVRQARPAARFAETPAAIGGPAPRVGEHTRAVLSELGYDEHQIERMIASGAVKAARLPRERVMSQPGNTKSSGRILWGVGTSRTIRAHWALCELGLDYEVRPILARSGETQTPQYTAINPRQKIPALQDGALVMTESAAIIAYLSDRYATPANALLPVDPIERARCLEWCFFLVSEIDATALYVMRRHVGLPQIYGEAPVAVEAAEAYFTRQMGQVERTLADGRTFLMGERFAAPDILLSTCISWAVGYKLPVADSVRAFNERATARPAFKAAQARNTPAGG